MLRHGQATFDDVWQIIESPGMSMDELTDFVVQVETNAGLNLHTDTWEDFAVERRAVSECESFTPGSRLVALSAVVQGQIPPLNSYTADLFNRHRTVEEPDGFAIAPLQRQTTELPSADHLFYCPCPSITATTSL